MIALYSRWIICHQCKSLPHMIENPPHTRMNCKEFHCISIDPAYIQREYISSSSQVMQVHSCSIYISLIYLHFDDYLFCQQPSKKGEIVGAMICPLCFGACWHKQFGTYVFASAHRVTGPWYIKVLMQTTKIISLCCSEGYHRRWY